ncbi:MAG: bifunctional riboflavin kinase/FAD synthetase [Xanthomonadales bacterium]|nr:bifunctional riboflavin kinase/FAD synthetase [Xanthomonadales bacterium]
MCGTAWPDRSASVSKAGSRIRLFRDSHGPCLHPAGSVVCVGAFDGLHRGHRGLIEAAAVSAQDRGLPLVGLSFEPLPRELFAKAAPPPRLVLPRGKIEGLRALGCGTVGLLRFNAAMVSMSPQAFIEAVLVQRLNAREIWVGRDFRFGHQRAGDFAVLQGAGARMDFETRSIDAVTLDDERVSSSRIRAALLEGRLDDAARLLGRPYAISGKVVRGAQLGRQLGYPTANLRFGGKVPALSGIYATRVHGVGAKPWPSVSSLGTRPTVNGREPLLEAHLFDFDGDLYGRRIEVEFVAKLREELKFDDLDTMVEQIHRDAEQARALLAHTQG